MSLNTKTIHLENLVLFNSLVQKSGGIMEIKSSYTDFDGDVLCHVYFTKPLTTDCSIEYEQKRIKEPSSMVKKRIKDIEDKNKALNKLTSREKELLDLI